MEQNRNKPKRCRQCAYCRKFGVGWECGNPESEFFKAFQDGYSTCDLWMEKNDSLEDVFNFIDAVLDKDFDKAKKIAREYEQGEQISMF